MSKLKDITGQKFSMLTVVSRAENAKSGKAMWSCVCDCGRATIVSGSNLRNGSVKSCGCLLHKTSPTKTHGQSKTRLYRIWSAIKNRCKNTNVPSYKDYGARGITVCDEWACSFKEFEKWALESGYSDELTIERIDNDKGYCPENCTWITKGEQAGHRRSCIMIEYKGKTQNLMQWCKELGLYYPRVHDRMYAGGMSFEEAISMPVMKQKRNKELRKKYG